MATKKTTAVDTTDDQVPAVRADGFSDDELRSIRSYQDALNAATREYGGVDDVAENLGNGFAVLPTEDKGKLVGVPFVILSTRKQPGDFGGSFYSAAIVTGRDERLILNDGGGLVAQLDELRERTNREGGWHVPRGLRVSEYDTCGECGRPRPQDVECGICGDTRGVRGRGKTYYLDTSSAQ